MTGTRGAAALTGAVTLLERSITYLLGSLALVRPSALSRPTPCADWDLGTLLRHVEDGLGVLSGAADGVVPEPGPGRTDPIEGVRAGARDVLGAWSAPGAGSSARMGGILVATAGAVEVAAHGWDIARACGWHRAVPATLADEMLDLVPLFVTAADRPVRFAEPVPLPVGTCAGDRLVAMLGRRPPDPAERRYLQSRAALLIARSR
jgi:uncharacterized protein (TIGR03086 family)